MGETGRAIVFPTIEQIVELNRLLIAETTGFHNGRDNLRNRNQLEWVLEAIQHPLLGLDPYPTIVEKSARLSWTIVADHVFIDGNKRTGMSTLLIFLDANNYFLKASDDDIVEQALRVASASLNNYEYQEYVEWIRRRLYFSPAGRTE